MKTRNLRETKAEIIKQIEQLESMSHYVLVEQDRMIELYADLGRVEVDLYRELDRAELAQYSMLG